VTQCSVRLTEIEGKFGSFLVSLCVFKRGTNFEEKGKEGTSDCGRPKNNNNSNNDAVAGVGTINAKLFYFLTTIHYDTAA